MKIISTFIHIVSYLIYLIGCFWFGVSLNIVGGLTLSNIGLYLIVLPTVAGFTLFNKFSYKWNVIIYFATIIYFLSSLVFFTGMNVFDINIYLIFIPVTIALTIDKLNSMFNTTENLEKIFKGKPEKNDDLIV